MMAKGWGKLRHQGTDSCSHWGWRNKDKIAFTTGPAVFQAFSPRTGISSLWGQPWMLSRRVWGT